MFLPKIFAAIIVIVINFTTESNNGEQACYTTEVMKQWGDDKGNFSKSYLVLQLAKHRELFELQF